MAPADLAAGLCNSAVELDPSLKLLPNISTIPKSRKKDVVHIKGEYGALTYGLRDIPPPYLTLVLLLGVGL